MDFVSSVEVNALVLCTQILIIYLFNTSQYYKVSPSHLRLSGLPTYHMPSDGSLSEYQEYIDRLPSTEHPEVFGQHPNADIASQKAETKMLFDTLLSLQPQATSASAAGSRPSREDTV